MYAFTHSCVLLLIHVFLSCSIYSFMYDNHIFISYNLIFISCHLLVTSYILLTYIFMYFIRLSYLMTYTYTFLYLYVFLVLYQTVLSTVGLQNIDSSLIPVGTFLIYTPLHIKSTYIAISCSYLYPFLPCIPINFNQVISTLGIKIQFSDKIWAPNAIK